MTATVQHDALFRHAVERLEATRSSPCLPCKICGADSLPYDSVDFYKSCEAPRPANLSLIPVVYRSCRNCRFIFTDFFDNFTHDQWRQHVYNDEYALVDPGYLSIRPRENVQMLNSFLAGRKAMTIGLDYGAGNGATAALMRERGWQFDSYDPFGHTDMLPDHMGRYNFCSAIEVFEHTPDPVGSLQAIVDKVSSERTIVMISTLQTDNAVTEESRLTWWYAAPRNGHVSLYSRKSMEVVASRFELVCTLVGEGPFFLTRGYSAREASRFVTRAKLLRRLRLALRVDRMPPHSPPGEPN